MRKTIKAFFKIIGSFSPVLLIIPKALNVMAASQNIF